MWCIINSISASNGFGSKEWLCMGVSVVPTTTLLCQGTANKTLPSSVLGIIMASLPGKKLLSSTKCIPCDGLTIFFAVASSICSTSSAKTPVALITTLHFNLYSILLISSVTITPQILLFSFIKLITLQ